MKTDTLFHEFFQAAPYALFDLLQIQPECAYVFSSPVLKASERRLDGLFEPAEPGHPRFFLEIQGYHDPDVYWRLMHGTTLFHLHNRKFQGQPWQAVLLFLDEAYDPGIQRLGTLGDGQLPWLVRGVIPDLLKQVRGGSPVLNVLRPLITDDEMAVRTEAEQWVAGIRQLPEVGQAKKGILMALPARFIVQKFTHIKREELDIMLKLTPIEETVAGREWMQEGQISILSEIIEHKFDIPASMAAQNLQVLSVESLKELSRVILGLDTAKQLAAWIEAHKPAED
jgi:predicted transposase YdaD